MLLPRWDNIVFMDFTFAYTISTQQITVTLYGPANSLLTDFNDVSSLFEFEISRESFTQKIKKKKSEVWKSFSSGSGNGW